MDGTLSIRAFAEADRAPVKALWVGCGLVVPYNNPDADIDLAAGRENSDVLVGCAADGSLVATAMVGHDGHRGWLYYVAVDPALQGQGIGKAAVRAAEDWLGRHGVWKTNLLVRAENAAVKGFYEALGYTVNPVLCMARKIEDAGG